MLKRIFGVMAMQDWEDVFSNRIVLARVVSYAWGPDWDTCSNCPNQLFDNMKKKFLCLSIRIKRAIAPLTMFRGLVMHISQVFRTA